MERAALMSSTDEVVEKELRMSTELLAEAGVDEPKTCGCIPTRNFLFAYLISNLISCITLALLVDPRTRLFYVGKTCLTGLGLVGLYKKSNTVFTSFAVMFGVFTLLWAAPVIAGVMVLFTRDFCSVLAGSSRVDAREFLNFCRQNKMTVRLLGTGILVGEMLLDTFVLVQVVKYQRYLRTIVSERHGLTKYHGKERIALP